MGGTGGGLRLTIMVCGLGCLAPGGGSLEELLRQPCTSLGEILLEKETQPDRKVGSCGRGLELVRARYRTYWFRAGTDSIFKSAPVSSEVEKTSG